MTLNISSAPPITTPIESAPAVLSRNKRGVADPDQTWPQHKVLKISLLNMTPAQKDLVKTNIKLWAPHTNLFFKFTDAANGDIRILANNESDQGWSWIGTSAKRVPPTEPTMSIGFKTPSSVLPAMIQHEFSHALGLKHEHQHPERTLELDTDNIYKEYEARGQFDGSAINEVIRKLAQDKVKTSDYDQKSIMHYEFPASRLKNREAIPRTTQLSEGDKQFIQSLYPADNSVLGKLLNTAMRLLINT